MRCFMHPYQEAISVCKRCGKAMCADCSSYTMHSGICPQCKRLDFIKERQQLQDEYNQLAGITTPFNTAVVWAIVLSIAVAVLTVLLKTIFLLVLLVVPACFAIKAVRYKKAADKRNRVRFENMRIIMSRIEYLTGEIDKLEIALQKGNAII